MSLLQTAIILNLLLGRLWFTPAGKQKPIHAYRYRLLLSMGFILIIAPASELQFFFISAVILHALDIFWVRQDRHIRYGVLLVLTLLVFPFLASFLTTKWQMAGLNPLPEILAGYTRHIPLINRIGTVKQLAQVLAIAAGYVFTLRESTLLIRNVLDAIRAVPQKDNKKDEDEYNRGRLIGVLERTFIYFLVLAGMEASVGLVLALKSFARYRELENRPFAEYFLIGTLLSILFAVLPALFVRFVL